MAEQSHALDAAIDLTGGVAGGFASVYVGQPLDTVKVKLQTFPGLFKNATDCFVKTFQQDGIARGLYAGTAPSLVAQGVENAVLFLAYGQCQRAVAYARGKKDISDLSILENAVAGSCASFFSGLTQGPCELIKCKQQAMKEMKAMGQLPKNLMTSTHIGPWDITKQILKEEGVSGMFRGIKPTLIREIPGYFFFFGGYALSRNLLTPAGKTVDDLSIPRQIFCGGIGGVCFWTSVFPSDVVKSRVQVQVPNTTGQSPPQGNFISMLMTIARNEGVLALYKGLGPTLLRTFPATGALFLAVEKTKQLLNYISYGDKNSIH